jgi:hypothetical protein
MGLPKMLADYSRSSVQRACHELWRDLGFLKSLEICVIVATRNAASGLSAVATLDINCHRL